MGQNCVTTQMLFQCLLSVIELIMPSNHGNHKGSTGRKTSSIQWVSGERQANKHVEPKQYVQTYAQKNMFLNLFRTFDFPKVTRRFALSMTISLDAGYSMPSRPPAGRT